MRKVEMYLRNWRNVRSMLLNHHEAPRVQKTTRNDKRRHEVAPAKHHMNNTLGRVNE